jgi:hypothetical protein
MSRGDYITELPTSLHLWLAALLGPNNPNEFVILLYQLGYKYLGCLFLSMIRQGLNLHRGFDRRLKSWASTIYKAGLYSYSPTTHLCSVPPPSASSSRCLCPRHRHTTFNITS